VEVAATSQEEKDDVEQALHLTEEPTDWTRRDEVPSPPTIPRGEV